MILSRPLAALVAAGCLLVSHAGATQCAGDPGYALSIVPSQVPVGTPFTTTITAPSGSIVVLLYSASAGPTPSPFGTLCVGLPLLGTAAFAMPAGEIAFPHFVDCVPQFVGFTGHVQFVAANPGDGSTHVSNAQTITLVAGPCPAGGFFPGDMVTYDQCDWGKDCDCGYGCGKGGDCGKNGDCGCDNVAACLRDAYFDAVFQNDLIFGDEDGLDGGSKHAVKLTSAKSVEKFLPEYGTPGKLKSDALNPTSTYAGEFGGHLTAAKLNVAFDAAGYFDAKKTRDDLKLKDMLFQSGVHPKLVGKSVLQVLAYADLAISGVKVPLDVDGDGKGDVGYSDLNQALEAFNENFEDGDTNQGVLTSP